MAFNLDWEHVAVVGKGGSSTVYKALIKSTGSFVAVKQIEIDGLSKDQISGIKGEIETMKDLSHPNILRYLGTQQSPNRVFIFLEYADRGSLRHFYSSRGPLSESQITFCLQGIVAGLNYLHGNGIAHRDIKCANCLLGSEGVVKLADFGASKRFESDSIVSGLKGTPHWMAPEVIKGTQMTTGWMKADVWSLGCTVVEMFTAKVPYAEYENPMTAMYKIASGEIPSLKPSALQPNTPSEELLSFIHTCCAVEPAARPGADQLLQHALLLREAIDVGDLFADTSLGGGTESVEQPIKAETLQAHSPTVTTQHEKENNKLAAARRSLEAAEATLRNHHDDNLIAASLRPRSDSASSVLSGNDDDETTIANHAESSYLEDDFCSYGYEDLISTRSRGESLSLGIGTGIGFNDCDDTNESTALTTRTKETSDANPPKPGKEPRIQARLTPLSVPRATSNSRSNSRSRGKSTGIASNASCSSAMEINTSSATAVDLDASAGSDLDDVATPSVFRDNGRSASMQMLSLLDAQVSGMTLSDTAQAPPALVRKWSATAFPEDILPPAEAETKRLSVDNLSTENPTESNQRHFNEEVVSEIIDFSVAEVVADQQRRDPLQSSDVRPVYQVPVVPSFEDANEVYKNMLQKYSPRGMRTSRDAPLMHSMQNSTDDQVVLVAKQSAGGNFDSASNKVRLQEPSTVSSEKLSSESCVDKPALEREKKDQKEPLLSAVDGAGVTTPSIIYSTELAPNLRGTPTLRSARTQEPSIKRSPSSNAKRNYINTKSNNSPLPTSEAALSNSNNNCEDDRADTSTSCASDVAPTADTQDNVAIHQEVRSVKQTQRSSKGKQKEDLAPLDANRARAMDPQRRQQAALVHSRPVAPITDPVQISNSSSSRPYAPLSGEKLRLHSFADPKKPLNLGGDGASGSSAEALERIVNQSGAAAVRKNAAQDLREVRTHKAKGSLNHHVIKATKRPRNQASPRHHHQHGPSAAPYGGQLSNQLGSAQGQNRVTAHMGMSGGTSLMNSGGVRSQSAGVNTGYSSLGGPAEPRKDIKLPPVLRGMNRNAIGSSSGSIDPIEEGRVPSELRLDGALNGPTSRYIQSAPAVSRSLNLPPINNSSQQGHRPSHRHGASVDSNVGLTGDDSPDEGAYLTSQTPKTKQPRLHNFGRPVQHGGANGVSAVLQQSFANVMKTYSTGVEQDQMSPTEGAL